MWPLPIPQMADGPFAAEAHACHLSVSMLQRCESPKSQTSLELSSLAYGRLGAMQVWPSLTPHRSGLKWIEKEHRTGLHRETPRREARACCSQGQPRQATREPARLASGLLAGKGLFVLERPNVAECQVLQAPIRPQGLCAFMD